MNGDMLNYVKGKLEEGEGISPAALTRILAAAAKTTSVRQQDGRRTLLSYACCLFASPNRWRVPALLAASLTIMAGGWLFLSTTSAPTPAATREANLANVIDLLRITDGDTTATSDQTLAENLLAWQDAPTTYSE